MPLLKPGSLHSIGGENVISLLLLITIIYRQLQDLPSIQIKSSASVSGVLPDQFRKDWLPGSTVISATGKFGEIAVQRAVAEGVQMYYILASTILPLQIEVTGAGSLFFIWIGLEGSLEINTPTTHHRFGGQNRYSLLCFTEPLVMVQLPQGKRFKSLVFGYPVNVIRFLLLSYPLLSELAEALERGKSMISREHSLSPSLTQKTYGLLHTPFVPLTEEYYRRTVLRIAKVALSGNSGSAQAGPPFSLYDTGCVHAAKEYIDLHLAEHLTLAQLAHKVGTNELKLKKGFKAIYGTGVHGYQMRQRLHMAASALRGTNKPVYQVARQAGYRNAANFSAAFSRVYGMSPNRYRRDMGQS